MKQMKTKSIFKRVIVCVVMMALFWGGMPSEIMPKVNAYYEPGEGVMYWTGKNAVRVYLSQDDFVTKGHTGNISISDNKLTITGWSYVYAGDIKYSQRGWGWDGYRAKWIKKQQTYILDKKTAYSDVDDDLNFFFDDEVNNIGFDKFEQKLEKYKNEKGVCVVIKKQKNKITKIAFSKTGKLTKTEKLKKKDNATVAAKGNFECDPENYGKVSIKKGKLIVKGNINTLSGELKKKNRSYAINSKCKYILKHKNVSQIKMKKALSDFCKGKYGYVYIGFKNNKVTSIEMASYV